MALGATMYVFEVRLADADRGVHEALTLRIARHPPEAAKYMDLNLAVSDRMIYLSLGEDTLTGATEERRIEA